MKAPQLETSNPQIRLVEPDIERDAALGVDWLQGELGRDTLALMGVAAADNHETSLEAERERVKGFIENSDQLNWMIQLDDKVIGSIWVDLVDTLELPAPGIHIMIGNSEARGHGVGGAATKAVIEYLKQVGHQAIYSRHLVANSSATRLLVDQGFTNLDQPYTDQDGRDWQNMNLDLTKD